MKNILHLTIAYLLLSCCSNKQQTKSDLKSTSIYYEQSATDSIINTIDSSFIGKEIVDNEKKKVISQYYITLNREFTRPEMADVYFSNIDSLISIFEYKKLCIKKTKIDSYVINIDFEDASYSSILFVIKDQQNNPYASLIVYENLESETNYKCYSSINSDIININRLGDNKNFNEKYQIENNNFLNYFDIKNITINQEWGAKKLIYTKDGLDSSYVHEYQMEGNIKSHLKEGKWVERRYILEYDKSVWVEGNYKNGLKDGEWYYSPEGPVDKVEVYNMGKLIKSFHR